MQIISLNETDSTNVFANKLRNQLPNTHGTVISTSNQTQGKGQRGNFWESEQDKNLTFSIILEDLEIKIEDQFKISQVVSLAILEYLNQHGDQFTIKWPNDIYHNKQKICGILIENSLSGNKLKSSIVGIGLNMNQTDFLSNAPNPISLKNITQKEYDLKAELKQLVQFVNTWMSKLKILNFDQINHAYIENMYIYKEWAEFIIADRKVTGRIMGINKVGQLLFQERNATQMDTFNFKEIKYCKTVNSEK